MNISRLLEIVEGLPSFGQMRADIATGNVRSPLELLSSARPPLLAATVASSRRPTLFISARVEAVPIWQQALEAWLEEEIPILRFPEPTPLPYERGPWSELARNRRLAVMARLMAGQNPTVDRETGPMIVLSSARALLQKTLPKRRFLAGTRVLRPGQLIDLEKLLNTWQASGYEPVSVVESVGQFSRRGGILDIFPVGVTEPARIELFGDEIETLRHFDPATQRSDQVGDGYLDFVVIPPAREAMPGDAQRLGLALQAEGKTEEIALPGWQDDLPALASGSATPLLEYYLPLIYPKPASLLDYCPEDTLFVVDDMADLISTVDEIHTLADQVKDEQTDLPPDLPSPLFEWPMLSEQIRQGTLLVLGDETGEARAAYPDLAEAFQPGPRYGGQVRPLIIQLKSAQQAKERTVVVSRQAQRLAELWREEGGWAAEAGLDGMTPIEQLDSLPAPGTITFVQGSLAGGFILEREALPESRSNGGQGRILLNLLTDAEVFGWSRPAPRRRGTPRPVAPETYFADISPGDYVVHLEFGIGRFNGLVVRNIGGMAREYLQVSFANGDVLYVPVHHADRLSRWVGPDDRPPGLNRLGEKSWKRTKAKAQEAVDELADDLLDLYAARETIAGHAFSGDSHWQAELEASFPYQETEDQLRAIAEVKADMERPYPMDRLICGDVGYGKTEVALRAAFKAVMDGKQVAMLVPTTVLAQQHYNTFCERLKPFPINVEMLSRFRTAARQELIIKRLREGQVDIVIGTHRLFSDDVSFKDLGLLIIDEEQRFGVAHKEKLKQLRTEVDVLTMTATPIPRTLYMSLTGVRDISQIDTAPADRLPVQTFVGEVDESLIRRAILRELDRGGQVYYVHNRVQTIQNVYRWLTRLVPDARIAIGHGQMSERELEDIMVRFVDGDIDVLLTTTIIESGLDIPNANTLIVDRADMFGLAQLYQLRGRVGRGIRQAYAYIFHPSPSRLTSDAISRLEVIESHTELGTGYNIAMRDLEIRGAGDLLGSRQSGHIAAVGFDLYTRLLTQAVKRRRAAREGQAMAPELPEAVLVDLPLAAYVPTDYVPDASLRLRLYRRMAILDSLADVDEMAAELADRFGPIPDPVDNLLYQLRIKVLAAEAGVAAVTTEGGQVRIRLPVSGGVSRIRLQRYLGAEVRVSRTAIWLGRNMSTHEWQVALVQVLEKLAAEGFDTDDMHVDASSELQGESAAGRP
ncbi:MAG: transcription-repair coupling factor [Candidatus Promineifilaceae bacterium]